MHIAAQNLYFLDQGRQLLGRLDDELFASAGTAPRSASVGAHLRHVIDCFHCFLGGLGTGRIDYDARQRQANLETERRVAVATLEKISRALEALDPSEIGRPLEVKVDAAAWEDPALHWHQSTLGRELQFLLSHTVHHYALIALILRGRGFDPGEDFGVAPSTLEHERNHRAAVACAH